MEDGAAHWTTVRVFQNYYFFQLQKKVLLIIDDLQIRASHAEQYSSERR
jgi:hypothetical protein